MRHRPAGGRRLRPQRLVEQTGEPQLVPGGVVPVRVDAAHVELGVAPRVTDQPELAVAQGSLVGTTTPSQPVSLPLPAPPVNAQPVNAPPVNAPPVNAPSRRERRRGRRFAVTGALVLLLAAAAALLVPQLLDRDEPGTDTGTGTPTTTATTSAGPSGSRASTDQADPNASSGRQWAGSRQFMEISSGGSRDGTVFLTVRLAAKNHLGESWETIPGTGPFVEVGTAADARAIRVQSDRRGPTSTMERLVRDLRERDPDDVEEGFEVTFSAFGIVQQVEWQFNPG